MGFKLSLYLRYEAYVPALASDMPVTTRMHVE